jgi:uncharacterized protein (TIGR03435 family)
MTRICLLVMFLGLSHSALAQQPSETFEVASIRQDKSGAETGLVSALPSGRFTVTNLSLRQLIPYAFGLRSYEVIGGPDWLIEDRFDIVATAGHAVQARSDGPPLELLMMFQDLLGTRFYLQTHRETREMPVFLLTVGTTNKRLGPNISTSDVDCAATVAIPAAQATRSSACNVEIRSGHLTAGAITMSQFVRNLASTLQRPVIDKTGFQGSFNIDLDWAPDANDTTKPSLVTALQEQLGLKLESSRGPVEVVVIDRIEHPSEN